MFVTNFSFHWVKIITECNRLKLQQVKYLQKYVLYKIAFTFEVWLIICDGWWGGSGGNGES
jgi:hypothetical protein